MVFLHDFQNQSKKKRKKSFSQKNVFQLPFNEYANLFHVCSASVQIYNFCPMTFDLQSTQFNICSGRSALC